ncbi:MAG: hypothetical protein HGA44_22870, partial [Cellulomonadaceae bacterium]|nr:hypothetical protein [Cellulomonadaceae bacterium]
GPVGRLYAIAAHGGAGTSTLVAFVPGLFELLGQPGPGDRVLVIARTSAAGLQAARRSLRHAALRDGADVLGLVLVADAPGRLPRPLRDLADLASGGAPRTWRAPWVEALRLEPEPPTQAPRELQHLVGDLTHMAAGHELGR